MFAQSLVLFLLSGFWFLTTVNSAIDEFSLLEKGLIFALVAAVLFVQALVLFAAAKVKTPLDKMFGAAVIVTMGLGAIAYAVAWTDWLLLVFVGGACAAVAGILSLPRGRRFVLRFESLVALFAAVNLYCLNLAFAPEFESLGFAVCALLLFAAWFVGCLFFAALQDGGVRKYATIAAAVLFLWQAALFPARAFWHSANIPPSPPGRTASENIRLVDFVKKPNVYFVVFESVAPPPILQRDLRLHASYADRLRELGFRRFKNAFSDGVFTLESVNRAAAMDADFYDDTSERDVRIILFNGIAPAPLYEIFQANGYRINVYNRDFLTGEKRGRFVDDYLLFYPLTMCESLRLHGALAAGFFGYCTVASPKVLPYLGMSELLFGADPAAHVDFYIGDFARKIAGGEPQFFFARVQSAFHATPTYDASAGHFAHFRNIYSDDVSRTADYASRIAEFVRQRDPGALVFFFGDHGLYTYPSAKKWGTAETESQRQHFIRDRYGVYAAISPADACREYLDSAAASYGYMTNSIIIRQIVRCLAGGEDPANGKVTYHLRARKPGDEKTLGYRGETTASFRDYLYEKN